MPLLVKSFAFFNVPELKCRVTLGDFNNIPGLHLSQPERLIHARSVHEYLRSLLYRQVLFQHVRTRLVQLILNQLKRACEINQTLSLHPALLGHQLGQLKRYRGSLPRPVIQGFLEQRYGLFAVAQVSIEETQRAVGVGGVKLVCEALQKHLLCDQVVTQLPIGFAAEVKHVCVLHALLVDRLLEQLLSLFVFVLVKQSLSPYNKQVDLLKKVLLSDIRFK